jgi:Fe-S cluster assembly protein SufD
MKTDALFATDAKGLMPDAAWLRARKAAAAEVLRTRGVPHRRVEDWKYSDLKATLEAANDLESGTIEWSLESLPSGIELINLARVEAVPEWVSAHFGKSAADHAMSGASLTLAKSGFALRVPRGLQAPQAVRLSFSGSGHGRALVVLEDQASLTLVETRPASAGFSNIGIEVVVGSGSRLTHVRIADGAPKAVQIEDVAVRVADHGRYVVHLMNGGGWFSRLNLRMTLKGQGAGAELSGVSVLADATHADVTSEVYHAVGDTRSTQLFKYVAGGKARGVYQGRVTVAKGANGSDSRQTAKGLLLSDRAEIDLKPELEILADDVKCAHGAAVGDLDMDSLFYLRARGIAESEARNLLIHAFLADALEGIENDAIRTEVWTRVEQALVQAGAV